MSELEESLRKLVERWKYEIDKWLERAIRSARKGEPLPPLPIPPLSLLKDVMLPEEEMDKRREFVVATRVSKREMELINILVEAGFFSTKSEAIAFLIREGIKKNERIFTTIEPIVKQIRRLKSELLETIKIEYLT